MGVRSIILALTWLLGISIGQAAQAQSIPIYALPAAPAMDGDDKDWGGIPFTMVPMKKTRPDGVVEVERVAIKAGTHANRVFLFVEWDDPSEDKLHKPWLWDESSQKYVRGPQREDRFAVQFGMVGDYTTNWRSGNEFTADTWHWKASRSNPLGLAHDKSLKVSRSKLLRGYKLELPDGDHVFLTRPADDGDKLYKTKRYRHLDQPLMPKYILTESPKGSVADVSARGVWSDGRWRLELSRALTTGNADDLDFPQGPGSVRGGIAVFDHSENDDHAISDTLDFEFLYRPWGPG